MTDPKFAPEELTTGDITVVGGDKPGDWMKDPNFLANAGHVGWGLVVMLVAVFFAPLWRAHPVWVPGISQLVLAAGIGFKEYYIDLRYESDETVGSSTIDFIGWMSGAALAWGAAGLGHLLGIWL